MFALTADGVPSMAKMVLLTGTAFRDGFESGSLAAWQEGEGDTVSGRPDAPIASAGRRPPTSRR